MKRTLQEKQRLGLMAIGMLLLFIVIVVRLGQLQIVNASAYKEIVDRQSGSKLEIPAERGMIYDRYGRPVAKNITRASLYANPRTSQDLAAVAAYVEKLFDQPRGSAVKRYKLKTNRFRWIKRHLSDELARQIVATAPKGLHLRDETKREYPFGLVGKQVLGFTNIDSKGLAGVELALDSSLAGKPGWADVLRDGLRNTYRVKETALVKPIVGESVVLTIDWRLQALVEEELAAAREKYNASSGMAAFVDCNTGDILAIAHNDPRESSPDRPVKLRAIADQFEPGSVFKPFTAAALMDAGIIDYADSIYCEMGYWKMDRGRLRDDKELGWLSFRRIIELSSNIGLGKCAIRAEGPKLIDTYHDFGFGRRPGSGLPGEVAGQVNSPSVWSDYNVSAMAMGHSVAVSALQLASAMAAIANDGELLRPNLVLGSVDDNGYVHRTSHREVVSRPVTKKSTDSLKSFLRGVVENGTAYPVNSDFVAISGKTGTAEIPNLEAGGYYKHKFMASFCGYFPSEAPVVAGIVVLEAPRPITYGGHTSGKAFRRIAERYAISNPDLFAATELARYEQETDAELSCRTPNLLGKSLREAQEIAERRGIELAGAITEGMVAWQFPPPDRQMLIEDKLLIGTQGEQSTKLAMIDLRGMTVRRAAAFLNYAGVEFTVRGNGKVRRQSIKPGSKIEGRLVCALECRPS